MLAICSGGIGYARGVPSTRLQAHVAAVTAIGAPRQPHADERVDSQANCWSLIACSGWKSKSTGQITSDPGYDRRVHQLAAVSRVVEHDTIARLNVLDELPQRILNPSRCRPLVGEEIDAARREAALFLEEHGHVRRVVAAPVQRTA